MGREDHPSFSGDDEEDDDLDWEEGDDEEILIGPAAVALKERVTAHDEDVIVTVGMRAASNLHEIIRFVDELGEDEAVSMRKILAWIEDAEDPASVASGLQWYISARLKFEFGICPICDERHEDEVERLLVNGEMGE